MNIHARFKATNAALICFRADGCMAHDHKFQWIGIITGFHWQTPGDRILLADVEVCKRDGGPYDIRDSRFTPETVVAANISPLVPGRLYMVMI